MWVVGGGELYSEAEAAVSMSRERSCNILFLQCRIMGMLTF